ncbi:uncharacterized protein LOC129583780 isoform X2 [Paramacrobiotus metropolitanus]|uniref:uncharacterized protein LOC129583780 isoform X2 n=1 Tax=Paramacrobiotus metropolitanus TaxID=2943436 RepID=UPI0024462F0B|nr:uncharacterized protein LOC129583780 isoform X2 [Paramacrobiotus metropolitanus]
MSALPFSVGQIVWAKIKGYNRWPACVETPPENARNRGLEPFTVGDQSKRELSIAQLQTCVKLAALKQNGNTVAPPVVPPTPQCAFMDVNATDSLSENSIATTSPAAEVSTPDLSHNYSFRGDEVPAVSEQDVISEVSGSTTGRNKGIIPLEEVDSWSDEPEMVDLSRSGEPEMVDLSII